MTSSRERALRWKSSANKENNLEEEFIKETLQRLIDLRDQWYAEHAYKFLEESIDDAENHLHDHNLLDRTIAYTDAKKYNDYQRGLHKQGIW